MPLKRTATPMTDHAIKRLIAQGVADALAEYEANRGSGNGDDSHDSRTRERRQGIEGVVGLTQWLEKMESVFHISNCTVANKVKFATCTLLGNALTWGEIKKLEIEIWNLKVEGTDVVSYTRSFQELALMCGRMFLEESDEVEKYVGGLPDNIQGSVMASKPKTMQDAIKIANELMDHKQSVAIAYIDGSGERKEYAGTLPSPAATNNQRTLTCYECENQGHYRSDCPELKNRNHGNQAGGTEVRGMVYALGGGETDQDLNNMEDDINA
ncbi:hypothetical protein Tco_0410816 [Tanacetum coccineum]